MKIAGILNCWTSCNTNIFKISAGFSSKLNPHDSLNLDCGRACIFDDFQPYQLYIKKQSDNKHIDLLDHVQDAILCDSHYVFIALARGLSVANLAYSKRFVFLFDFWFETTAGIKIIRLDVIFGALVTVGGEIEFRLHGDLGVAQSDFLQKCRIPANVNGNCLKFRFLDFL